MNNLPNVEVVSLSVNRISSLKDFQNCQNLRELYVRKNEIIDYHEVDYLVVLFFYSSEFIAFVRIFRN
jgi:Leucine-rich repeat (LRR) protein